MRKTQLVKLALLLGPALLTATFLLFVIAGPTISLAQNSNSSTTTNVNRSREVGVPNPGASQSGAAAPAPPPQDFSKNTWELPPDADKTKNPVAVTPESIAKGKELYLERSKGNCIFCHGESGAGNEANRGVLRRKPADLTNKERMTAMTDGEVFWKISKGITGIMPAGERRMSEEERWHVTNYIRTLVKEPAK